MNAFEPPNLSAAQTSENDAPAPQDTNIPEKSSAKGEPAPVLQDEQPAEKQQTEERPPKEQHEEDPVSASPAGPGVEDLLKAVAEVSNQVERLAGLFEDRILYTEHEGKIVSQMHRELQKYKDDLYAQLVRPILLDVIKVRDNIQRMSALYREKPEGQQDIPNETFLTYAEDLRNILEENNVEIYRSEPGSTFIPIRQKLVQRVPTTNPAQNGTIEASMSCGYSYGGRTISAEKVSVYCYEKPPEEVEINTEEKSEVIDNG